MPFASPSVFTSFLYLGVDVLGDHGIDMPETILVSSSKLE